MEREDRKKSLTNNTNSNQDARNSGLVLHEVGQLIVEIEKRMSDIKTKMSLLKETNKLIEDENETLKKELAITKKKLADQELAAVPIEKRVNNLNKEVNQSNSGKLEAVFNSKMKLQKDKLLTTHSIRMHQYVEHLAKYRKLELRSRSDLLSKYCTLLSDDEKTKPKSKIASSSAAACETEIDEFLEGLTINEVHLFARLSEANQEIMKCFTKLRVEMAKMEEAMESLKTPRFARKV